MEVHMKKQKYNNNNQKSIRKSNKGKIALATIGLTTVALGATYGVFHQQINAGVNSVFDRLRNPSTKVEQQDKIDNQSILINDLKNDLAVKDEEIRNAVSQIEALTATKSTLESDLQSKSNLLAEKETALASLQSEYDTKTAEYTTKKAQYESQIDNLNNTNSELNENLESLQSEYDSATLEYNTKKTELEAELESLGEQNTELETQLQSLQDEYDTKTAEYNNTKSSLESQISTLEIEKESLTTSYNTLQSEHNTKVAEYETEKTNLNNEISTLNTTVNNLTSQLDSKNTELSNLQSHYETLQAEYDELEEKYYTLFNSSFLEQFFTNQLTDLIIPDNITSLEFDRSSNMADFNSVTNILDYNNVTSLICNHGYSAALPATNAKYVYASKLEEIKGNALVLGGVSCKLGDFSKCNEIYISGSSRIDFDANYIFKLNNLRCYNTLVINFKGKYLEIGNIYSDYNSDKTNNYLSFYFNDTDPILVLKGNEVLRLDAFQSAIPTVYVPDDLVDSYKSAPAWSSYADHIHPISELPEGVDTVEYWENLENAN